jgi:hypothetical protein
VNPPACTSSPGSGPQYCAHFVRPRSTTLKRIDIFTNYTVISKISNAKYIIISVILKYYNVKCQLQNEPVYLVVMTTTRVCCSQIILQKSPHVFGKGP